MAEKEDARAYARQIYEQVADKHADSDDADLYLAKLIAELFEMSPGAREHISDLLIADLCEELGGRGEEDAMRAVLKVQRDWAQAV